MHSKKKVEICCNVRNHQPHNISHHLTTSPSHHFNTTSTSHHITITACTSSTAALAASTTHSASQASSATFSTICAAAYRPKSSPSARLPKQSLRRTGGAAVKCGCWACWLP
ncbi:hypothetical protein [Leyella stercorea]|uniref:hypothetical protein n=1 Tax=Leyella stercorea TaxID=363265 RepID=UPI00258B69B1|nr:hypothetical protein [Leyella stercorea]